MATEPQRQLPALRRIAVYVDEPKAGRFAWVLIEASNEQSTWEQLEVAGEWWDNYREAMAAGLLALQARIEDLDAGPREAPAKSPSQQPDKHPRGARFGFGFGDVLP